MPLFFGISVQLFWISRIFVIFSTGICIQSGNSWKSDEVSLGPREWRLLTFWWTLRGSGGGAVDEVGKAAAAPVLSDFISFDNISIMALFDGTDCCCCFCCFFCCTRDLCWFIICCFVNHSNILFLRTRKSSADFWRWNCFTGSGGGSCWDWDGTWACCRCFCGNGGRAISLNSLLMIDFGLVPLLTLGVGAVDNACCFCCCLSFTAVSMSSSKAVSRLYGKRSSQCAISFFNASNSSGPEKWRWWCLWCLCLFSSLPSAFGNVDVSIDLDDVRGKCERSSHSSLNSFCWLESNFEPLRAVCRMPFVGASIGTEGAGVVGPTWLANCICLVDVDSPVDSCRDAGWCLRIVPVGCDGCWWWCCCATKASVFCSSNWANFFLSRNFRSPFKSLR